MAAWWGCLNGFTGIRARYAITAYRLVAPASELIVDFLVINGLLLTVN